MGEEHGLSLACPVDEEGRFSGAVAEAAPFAGLEALGEGGAAVLQTLQERGRLLAADPKYQHRYPYDWRSKTPVLFRTTPQARPAPPRRTRDALPVTSHDLRTVSSRPQPRRPHLSPRPPHMPPNLVVIPRTAQWFVRLEQLQPQALGALHHVAMDPPASRARLEAFVRGRKEWCLSRQRSWGVPLPAFFHVETGEPAGKNVPSALFEDSAPPASVDHP